MRGLPIEYPLGRDDSELSSRMNICRREVHDIYCLRVDDAITAVEFSCSSCARRDGRRVPVMGSTDSRPSPPRTNDIHREQEITLNRTFNCMPIIIQSETGQLGFSGRPDKYSGTSIAGTIIITIRVFARLRSLTNSRAFETSARFHGNGTSA